MRAPDLHEQTPPQPERKAFGEFAIDMSPFVLENRDGITLYKEGPLFQGETDMSMPLAQRQIVTVRDEATGKLVNFDVITKGFNPVRFGEPLKSVQPETPAYLSDRLRRLFSESFQTLRASQDTHPRATRVFTQPESHYIFTTQGRQEWEDAVMGHQPGVVLTLRSNGRIAPGPGGAFIPQDLPDDATIQRAAAKVNQAFSLGIDQSTIQSMHASTEKELPTMQIGEFTMQQPQLLQTPWSKEPLYLTTYTTIGPDGDTMVLQTLTSQDPISLIQRAITGTDSSEPINIGMERFCPCMRGRKGCDCYHQMEQRLQTLFSDPQQATKDNIYVFMPLDATMAYGEAWGDMEHKLRAQLDGVLETGQVPTTSNVTIRQAMIGENGKLDRTNYQPVAQLLKHLYRTDKRGFNLYSDNKLKVAALGTVGEVTTIPTNIEDHPVARRLGHDYFAGKDTAGNYGYKAAVA